MKKSLVISVTKSGDLRAISECEEAFDGQLREIQKDAPGCDVSAPAVHTALIGYPASLLVIHTMAVTVSYEFPRPQVIR